MTERPSRALAEALRRLYPPVLAQMLRTGGDLADAEDAVQDALARAVELWPTQGWPDKPEAWLFAVAKNRFLDGVRRRQRQRERSDALAQLAQVVTWSAPRDRWGDELLALVVTCCDPALARHEAIALTLASVLGLSHEELGRLFCVTPTAMQQRLTRARQRLRGLARGYARAGRDDLLQRRSAVLGVLRATFDEGYWSTGERPMRPELTRLAIELTRSLSAVDDHPAVTALLGLMLLLEARRPARLDEQGRALGLRDQDRSLYDATMLEEGLHHVERALAEGSPDPLLIEAAIAAVHARAPRADATDWAQIAALYAMLEERDGSPIVRVNRAVAVAEAEGPQAALALLDEELDRALAQRPYPYLPLLRGRLLAELGRVDEAALHLERAQGLARNDEEARQIRATMDQLIVGATA